MMAMGNADERGFERQKGYKSAKSGGEPPRSGPDEIDWRLLRDELLRKFDRTRTLRNERAIGCASAADAIQSVIADLFEVYAAGEGPRTHDELVAKADRDVRCRLSSWQRREKRHAAQLRAHAATFSSGDLFDMICRRDEQKKFFARMYEEAEKDPEAKQVLILVLEKDMPYKQTRVLAEVLMCTPAQVTNIKRRLVRMGARIMQELDEPNPKGDGK